MKRREFIKQAGFFAVGVGVSGVIRATDHGGFVGDTPTTTDILGPYYRPGAPFRENLNPRDFKGEVLHFFGTIFRSDGKTPMNDCLLEIWQCQEDGNYDNVSEEFLRRASQRTGPDGSYRFITTIPVPYSVAEGVMRPAHIHMRISAVDMQDLITQVYFQGDPYLKEDPSTKSALTINRILPIKQTGPNVSEIRFDVILSKEYVPDDVVFAKISGVYAMSNSSKMEFYRDRDLLFYKTDSQIWGGLSYSGNNTFVGGVDDTEARFELLPHGETKVHFRFSRRKERRLEGRRIFSY